LLGVPAHYLVGKPVAVFTVMDDRPALREAINSMARVDYAEFTARILPRGLPMRICYIRLSSVHDEVRGPLRGIRWVIRDVTEARRAEEEIASTREKLRELASELSLAEERVRREIAVGIHDRVSQPLAMVKILLGKIKLSASSEQSREIGELSGLVQQAIDESRTLTFELSPPVLYELGLPAAVEWLAEQIQRRHGVKIRVQSTPDWAPIALELRVLLFQSIRELLINIIKHSQAKSANINLHWDRKLVQAIVSDNGIGFSRSPSPSREGFGLFSIRTRVERVGGQFSVDSKSGRGARVTVIVPLHEEPAALKEGNPNQESKQAEE
jgi:signal transduction histidine kinase